MWWALAAQFAMSYLSKGQEAKQIKANNKNNQLNMNLQNASDKINHDTTNANNAINAELSDKLQAANNQIAGAAGALARYRQSVGNQQILKNAATQNEALAKNLFRLQDQSMTADVNTRIQAAEQTGALMAQASSAGVGGSTIDQIAQVVKGKEARALENSQRNITLAQKDTLDRIRATTEQGILGQDSNVFIDRVSHIAANPNQLPDFVPRANLTTQQVPSFASQIGAAALGTLGSQSGIDAISSGASAAANWFKTGANTPQIEPVYSPQPGVVTEPIYGNFFN
ncbi:internal virion protein [Pseudomonas phage vB_PpuP-Villemi]